MAMPNPKHFEACFLCRQPFEFGSQVDQGTRMPERDMMTCRSCYDCNRDGIVSDVFPHETQNGRVATICRQWHRQISIRLSRNCCKFDTAAVYHCGSTGGTATIADVTISAIEF